MLKKYQTELSLVKKLKRRVSEAIGATAEISIENKADENESKESEGTEKNIENEIDKNEIEDLIMNETEEEVNASLELVNLEKNSSSIKK